MDNQETKQGIIQGAGSVTTEELKAAVEAAKEIILYFVEELFGEENKKRVLDLIDKTDVGIDTDPKVAENCSAYYNDEDKNIFITESFFKKNINTIGLISTIIHEFAHDISYNLSPGRINDVFEEALANLFAEMSINKFLKDKGTIEYCNLKYSYRTSSYPEEGKFFRCIMYALETKNSDLLAFGDYFFGNKLMFEARCKNILGDHFERVLKILENVEIFLYMNNSEKYLPQATCELKEMLADFFNAPMEKTPYRDVTDRLYMLEYEDAPLLADVYRENELKYKYFGDIDFSSPETVSQQITRKDIQRASNDFEYTFPAICRDKGYSNFIKKLIHGWYLANKNDLERFDLILQLTGTIPLEIFKEIIKDNKITDNNTILQMLLKYSMNNNTRYYYFDVLEYINELVCNDFSKNNLDKESKEQMLELSLTLRSLIERLLTLELSDDELSVFLKLFSRPVDKNSIDNMIDVLDVLKNADFSKFKSEQKSVFAMLIR